MEKPADVLKDEEEAAREIKAKKEIKKTLSRQLSKSSNSRSPLMRSNSSNKKEDDEKDDDDEAGPRAPIMKILMLSMPEWPGMFLGAICTLAGVVPEALAPLLFGLATTAIKDGKNASDRIAAVNYYMALLVALIVAGAFINFVKSTIFGIAGERVVLRLREQLLEAIMTSDISMLDRTESGKLVSRLTVDVMNVQSVATSSMVDLFTNIVKVVVMIFIMLKVSGKLTSGILIASPLLWLIIFPLSHLVGKLSERYQDKLADATSLAQETIANFRTVRSCAAEQYSVDRYINVLGDMKKSRCWLMREDCVYRCGVVKCLVESMFQPFVEVLFGGILYGSLWCALILACEGQFDIGMIFTFLVYAIQIMETMGGLGGTFGSFVTAATAAGKVFALLDAKPEIPTKGGKRPDQVFGEVAFKNIHFTYPGSDQETLSGLDCIVPPQTTAAFVGASGCGKSTTLRLLERFYDVSKGSICIDGNDVRELDGSWIRTVVAFVQQEPNLFAMSVEDNVNYSRMAARRNQMNADPISQTANSLTSIADSSSSDTEKTDIINACKAANAHDFVENFQDGYKTMVGERGMKLSGGQKQRIAIARAILQNPTIMLLDEATSALDAESEHLVSEAINNMMKGRTVLLVAHRLSTVRNATSIHYVKDGRIVDSGTHETLLRKCADYKHLVEHQMG